MKNFLVCFLTVVPIFFIGCTQHYESNQLEPVVKSITPNGIRSHMNFLADDLLEGRRPGTRGYQIAANYVESELISSGILPAGEKGFRQSVPMVHATTDEGSSEFTLSGKINKKLSYGDDYIISPDFIRSSHTLTAPVVFAGFGVIAPEFGYDDYQDLDVKGKVVLLLSGAPASFDSNPRAYFSSVSVKYESAKAKGAIAVINFSPEELSRYSWEALSRRASGGSIRWADEAGIGNGSFEELGILASVSPAVAKLFFADAKKTYEQVVQAAMDSEPIPLDLKKTVTLTSKTNYKSFKSDNVIGKLEGSDPELKKENIVYVAHIDHFGIGKPVDGDSIYNGAHDNASGVSILLEIAQGFTKFKNPPKRSVMFLFVTGEEYGLQGSDYFIQHPTVPKASIIANISLDMPFLFHPLKDIVPYGAAHSSIGDEVHKVAEYMNLNMGEDPIPQQVLFIRSDHFSFVKNGVPSLFNKSGFETGSDLDGKEVNLNWRATRYHTPQDDMNQNFDFEAGADHGRFNLLVGYHIAQNPNKPQWNEGDFFGERFGEAIQE